MADVASAIAYGAGLQGQATFATGATTAVWAYSPWALKNMMMVAGFEVVDERHYSGLSWFVAKPVR